MGKEGFLEGWELYEALMQDTSEEMCHPGFMEGG